MFRSSDKSSKSFLPVESPGSKMCAMKLDLTVLAAATIKRKKPWPRFCWLGEQAESLLMLDSHRASLLYLPSGKTKKKIPKLKSVLDDAMVLNYSSNGHYLAGLLQFGNIFLWDKDRDAVRTVQGLPEFRVPKVASIVRREVKPSIHVSDDGAELCVVMSDYRIYHWKLSMDNGVAGKKNEISGRWIAVDRPDDIRIPSKDDKEAVVAVAFHDTPANGPSTAVSFVFVYEQNLTITTMTLAPSAGARVLPPVGTGYSVKWGQIQYAFPQLTAHARPVRSRGALLARFARGLPILAVAVNQKRPSDTRLVYFSPGTETMLTVDMKDCGVRDGDRQGRSYWLADIKWSFDDLFVVCITKHGSVCVTTRLGEPVLIQSRGSGMGMGPAYFLPFHPLITVQSRLATPSSELVLDSAVSEMDVMRQRFSLCVHPSQHIYLFSDGYSVTVVSLPGVHVYSVMRDLVLSSNRTMQDLSRDQNLELSLMDTLKFEDYNSPNSTLRSAKKLRFEFEETLDSTADSEMNTAPLAMFGVPTDVEAGKIIFADLNIGSPPGTTDSLDLRESRTKEQRMMDIRNWLFSSWAIAVSNPDRLTVEMETLTTYVAHLLVKSFRLILHDSGYSLPGTSTSLEGQSVPFPDALNQIIDMYKSVVTLCKFDAENGNVMPILINFTRGTLGVLLQARQSENDNVRLEAMNASLAMLLFLEDELSEIYALLPVGSGASISSQAHTVPRGDVFRPGMHELVEGTPVKMIGRGFDALNSRLGKAWKSLYQHVARQYRAMSFVPPSPVTQQAVTKLLCKTQTKLQKLNMPLCKIRSKTEKGDGLYLEGSRDFASSLWKESISRMSPRELETGRATRLLHSIFYTAVETGDLEMVVQLADTLLLNINEAVRDDVSRDEDVGFLDVYFDGVSVNGSKMSLPCTEFTSARTLVRSLGRFMARYFCNESLYIYPAHCAEPIASPLGKNDSHDPRVIPVYHETVSLILRQNQLDTLWTSERALEYLLVTGLLTEAVWFCEKMGDWKAAFVLAVSCESACQNTSVDEGLTNEMLHLPESLTPCVILRRKLELLVSPQLLTESPNESESASGRSAPSPRRASFKRSNSTAEVEEKRARLEESMRDLFTAACVSQQTIVPSILANLVDELKAAVRDLEVLVPRGFYLPAPPLYCPQPDPESTSAGTEVLKEHALRERLAALIQMILIVLNASRCSLPLAKWYSQELKRVHPVAESLRSLSTSMDADLNEILAQFGQAFDLDSSVEHVRQVMTSFRDFITVTWMLHARDEMTIVLRQREEAMMGQTTFDEEEWLWTNYKGLQWACHLIPFTQYMDKEGSTYAALLSMLAEFPSNMDSADILVEFFHDTEALPAEIQEKFQRVMKNWQKVFLGDKDNSPSHSSAERLDRLSKDPGKTRRGKTLSAYFQKQSLMMDQTKKQRQRILGAYEEFIFMEDSDDLCIGSRLFEIEGGFLNYLDTFFSVCFTKQMDVTVVRELPLLVLYSKNIQINEFNALSYKIATNLQNRLAPVSPSDSKSPKSQDSSSRVSMTPPVSPRKAAKDSPRRAASATRPRYMRRSMSVQEIEDNPKPAGILKKSSSQSELDSISFETKKKVHRSVSFCQDSMYFGSYPMHRANSLNAVNSPSPDQSEIKLELRKEHRSLSLTDLRVHQKSSPPKGRSSADMSFSIYLAYRTGVRDVYPELAKLLEWLQRWSNKHHQPFAAFTDIQASIRVKFHPHLILLCLWLLENKYIAKPREEQCSNLETAKECGLDFEINSHPRLIKSWEGFENKEDRLEELLKQDHRVELEVYPVRYDERTVDAGQQADLVEISAQPQRSAPPPAPRSRSREYAKKLNFSMLSKESSVEKFAAARRFGRRHADENRSLDCSSTLNISSLAESLIDVTKETSVDDEIRTASTRVGDVAEDVIQPKTASPRLKFEPTNNSRSTKSNTSDKQFLMPDPAKSVISVDDTPTNNTETNLQDVIRSELRRFVHIQHQGVLAMLGAVGGIGSAQHQPNSNSATLPSAPLQMQSSVSPESRWLNAAATQTTMSLHENADLNNTRSKVDDETLVSSNNDENIEGQFRNHTKKTDSEREFVTPGHSRESRFPPLAFPAWGPASVPVQHAPEPLPRLAYTQTASPEHAYYKYGIPLLHMPTVHRPPPSTGWMPGPSAPRGPSPQAILQKHLADFAQVQKQTRFPTHVGIPLLRMQEYRPHHSGHIVDGARSDVKRGDRREQKQNEFPQQTSSAVQVEGLDLASIPRDTTQRGTQMTPKHQRHTETQVTKTVSDVTDESMLESASAGVEERPVGDGYALSRGLFDEYLADPACHAGPDTVTRLQYQLFAQDAAAQNRRSELSKEAKQIILDYIQQQASDTDVLPPDLLFSLKFQNEGKPVDRRFINVVDIDSGALTDLRQAIPEKSHQPEPRPHSSPPKQKPKHVTVSTSPERAEPRFGPDKTTLQAFSSKSGEEPYLSSADILSGRAARDRHQRSMLNKLDLMGAQLDAVEEMSKHVDTEYSQAKMTLNNLERLTETMHADEEQHRKLDGHYERVKGATPRLGSPGRAPRGSAPTTTPRRSTETTVPPRLSDSPPESRSPRDVESSRADITRLSGLSGVSDIIGEVIGDIDLKHTGLTEKQAQTLKTKSKGSELRLSSEKLHKIFPKESTPRTFDHKEERDRKKLQEWMKERQKRQSTEYMKLKQDRLESEHRPYQPIPAGSEIVGPGTYKVIKTMQVQQLRERQAQKSENVDKRTQQAQELMAEILHDQPPEPPVKANFEAKPNTDTRNTKMTDEINAKPHGFGRVKKGPNDSVGRAQPSPVRHSGPIERPSRQTSDVGDTYRIKPYQPRPFQQVVRLQRPETTRQKEAKKPVPYVDRLAEINRSAAVSRPITPKSDPEKLYGSRHLPRQHKSPPTARHVKTYTERLQEMKTSPTKPTGSVSIQSNIRESQEYATSHLRPLMVAKKAPHEVVPYHERLKLANASAPRMVEHRDVYEKTPRLRAQRQRPYQDPYASVESEVEPIGSECQMSPWRLDEQMHNILYSHDEDDSLALGAEALPYDSVELATDLDEVADHQADYQNMVNVQDIVDAVSLSDASVMSVIDWDAVDKLIADVN